VLDWCALYVTGTPVKCYRKGFIHCTSARLVVPRPMRLANSCDACSYPQLMYRVSPVRVLGVMPGFVLVYPPRLQVELCYELTVIEPGVRWLVIFGWTSVHQVFREPAGRIF
jgi:hypothetical protein